VRQEYTPPYHMPLSFRQRELVKNIEEAEWIGDDASAFYEELHDVRRRLMRGDKWEALF
jgi:hypothetical protein